MNFFQPYKKITALICAFALFFTLSACKDSNQDEEKTFYPQSVSIESLKSAVPARTCLDEETVSALFALYSRTEGMSENENPTIDWNMRLTFVDESGRELYWELCPDGSFSRDGEKFFLSETGEGAYREVCGYYDQLLDIDGFSAKLYELKNDYIGNAAVDSEILTALGIEELIGPYTMNLQTQYRPYGIKLSVSAENSKLSQACTDTVLGRCGYLFLALVENAGAFSWEYETPSGLHSGSVYSHSLDIKQYGADFESFKTLCASVDGLSAADLYPADVMISSGSSGYIMYGADAKTVSKLWDAVNSVSYEEAPAELELSEVMSLCFYNAEGEIVSVWSFAGDYCLIGGLTETYHITSGSINPKTLKSIYEASRTSPDYSDGVYIMSSVFGGKLP